MLLRPPFLLSFKLTGSGWRSAEEILIEHLGLKLGIARICFNQLVSTNAPPLSGTFILCICFSQLASTNALPRLVSAEIRIGEVLGYDAYRLLELASRRLLAFFDSRSDRRIEGGV